MKSCLHFIVDNGLSRGIAGTSAHILIIAGIVIGIVISQRRHK